MATADDERALTPVQIVRDTNSQSLNPPTKSEQSDHDQSSELQRFLPEVPEEDPELESGAILPCDDAADAPEDDVRNPDDDILANLEKQKPPDRFFLVYIIVVIHGVGLLMPWNMFITAKSYFEDHKLLADASSSAELKDYRANFMAYVGMASQFPCTIMNLMNLFCQCGGRPGVRIIGSIIVIIVVFVATIILAMVDSSAWPIGFFWITMFSVVVINSASGVYQNSLFGVVACLPMKYTNAIIFGNNFSGTFVSVLNIVMIVVAPDARSSAMYYFLTAVLVLLVAVDSFFVLPHTKFFRHYDRVMKLKQQQRLTSRPRRESCGERVHSYWEIFKQIWDLALSVWFVFFVSVALFPQIQSDIKRHDISFPDAYWTPVFCYLSFNLCAMLGNLLTEIMRCPGPRWVWLPVAVRVVFIPLYLMFNFRPDSRTWSAPLANDYAFIFTSVGMAFSGGYLSSLCMMYAPAQVERQDAGTAGMMMAFFLVLGILSGVNASRLLVLIVT